MIDRLKVIELLRYNINSNVERVSEKIVKTQSDSTNETISAVFATGFSLVAVEIGDAIYSLLRKNPIAESLAKIIANDALRHLIGVIVKSFVVLVLFSMFFAVTYQLAKRIRARILRWQRAREIHKNRESDYKKFIDDFDHTACDALLFSEYFLDACEAEGKEGNEQKKLFNLYESMYYLSKAQSITETIFRNKEYCISDTKPNKIATHRLKNAVTMMGDLEEEINTIIQGTPAAESVHASFTHISEVMSELRKEMDIL